MNYCRITVDFQKNPKKNQKKNMFQKFQKFFYFDNKSDFQFERSVKT